MILHLIGLVCIFPLFPTIFHVYTSALNCTVAYWNPCLYRPIISSERSYVHTKRQCWSLAICCFFTQPMEIITIVTLDLYYSIYAAG